jgi:DNA polymerase-4
MDAYFASVEQQSNPFLKGKPIIITGRSSRTVIATASYEARAYGIKTGMTVPEAKKLCPHLVRVDVNPDKYMTTTLRIRKILIRFTDQVEMYSIDEFFLDITGSQSLLGTSKEIVRQIKDTVHRETGLTCSCGIAPNKLLAKLGSELQKPDGLAVVNPENFNDILRELPVDKLHGLGKKTAEALKRIGISTIGELGDAPISLLNTHFGFWGHILKRMGQGIDNSPVSYYWKHDDQKSMGHSHTLPADTSNPVVIKAYTLMLCQRVAMRLRNDEKAAYTVALTIRDKDFKTVCYRKTAGYLLDTPHGIYHTCLRILRESVRIRKPVRLIGVSVTNLVDIPDQRYLIDEFNKSESLNKAIVMLNNKYGEFAIKPASLLILLIFLKYPFNQVIIGVEELEANENAL